MWPQHAHYKTSKFYCMHVSDNFQQAYIMIPCPLLVSESVVAYILFDMEWKSKHVNL